MSTLRERIESYIPEVILSADIPAFISWFNDALNILVYIVDPEDAKSYMKTFAVTTAGLDVSAMRFIRASKAGRIAGEIPPEALHLVSDANYKGLYQVSAIAPGYYMEDREIYIVPDGGEVRAFGVNVIDSLEVPDGDGIPAPLQTAAIYYTSMQGVNLFINRENQKKILLEEFVEPSEVITFPTLTIDPFEDTITLETFPTSPSETSVASEDSTAPTVSIDPIASPSMPAGNKYTKTTVTIDYGDSVGRANNDDIEMLNGELSKIQTELQEFSTKMQNELNRVNTEIREYESQIQHSLEQGRLAGSANNLSAQLASQNALSNAQNKLQALIEEKRQLWQKYQLDIQSATADNQSRLTKWQTEVQTWVEGNKLNVAKFEAEVGFLLQTYQTDLSTKLGYYQTIIARHGQNNNTHDSKIQSYFAMASNLMQMYQNAVTTYIRSIQSEKYVPAPVNPEAQA